MEDTLTSRLLALALIAVMTISAGHQVVIRADDPTPEALPPTARLEPPDGAVLAATLDTVAIQLSAATAALEPQPTPMPTLRPGAMLSAELTAARCARYAPFVYRWREHYPDQAPALVLAIAAKETGCDPAAELVGDGLGFMGVVPASWSAPREVLVNVGSNVFHGQRILQRAWDEPQRNPERDLRRALAAYNCWWPFLDGGGCAAPFGYHYADSILGFWMPLIEEALTIWAASSQSARLYPEVQAWLWAWGYRAEPLPALDPPETLPVR